MNNLTIWGPLEDLTKLYAEVVDSRAWTIIQTITMTPTVKTSNTQDGVYVYAFRIQGYHEERIRKIITPYEESGRIVIEN